MRNILAALGKIGILGLILCAFALGLAGTVYLSLRSPNVQVPDVTNKSVRDGETALEATGLSIRERAKRFKSGVEPGVILDQFPRGGAIVKQGQTVAVIVSRAPREGESPTSDEIVEKEEEKEQEAGSNSNANQNRERRRANRNANANNSNSNANSGNQNATNDNQSPRTNGNSNVTNANRPAGNQNANRNANAGRPGNANDNRGRNSNSRNATSANNSRGATTGTRNANTNRRPNP